MKKEFNFKKLEGFNFKKLEGRYSKNQEYVSINNSNLNISTMAFKALGEPKAVDIYLDIEKKAIKIVDGTDRIVSKKSIGSTSFAKLLPKGRYLMIKDNIFIYHDTD